MRLKKRVGKSHLEDVANIRRLEGEASKKLGTRVMLACGLDAGAPGWTADTEECRGFGSCPLEAIGDLVVTLSQHRNSAHK